MTERVEGLTVSGEKVRKMDPRVGALLFEDLKKTKELPESIRQRVSVVVDFKGKNFYWQEPVDEKETLYFGGPLASMENSDSTPTLSEEEIQAKKETIATAIFDSVQVEIKTLKEQGWDLGRNVNKALCRFSHEDLVELNFGMGPNFKEPGPNPRSEREEGIKERIKFTEDIFKMISGKFEKEFPVEYEQSYYLEYRVFDGALNVNIVLNF